MAIVQLLESIRHIDNKDLFIVDYDGIEIIFRLPTIKQAVQLMKVVQIANGNDSLLEHVSQAIFDEYVTEDCVAKKKKTIPAGIEISTAQLILYLSGATDDAAEYRDQLIDVYRGSVDSITNAMKRWICVAFQSYRFEHLDRLNYQELLEIFVNAEQSLLDRGIIEKRFEFSQKTEAKQHSIGDMIKEDSREYRQFDASDAPKPRADQIAQLRQERMRQIANRRGG